MILTVLVVAIVAFAGGYLIGGQNSKITEAPEMAAVGAASALARGEGAIMGVKSTIKDSPLIPVGNSYVMGNPNAPITVVEFSDFQCPYCQRGADTIKKLVEKYPNDVRVVFKHNPLPFHKQAPAAHKASFAAAKQGKFVEMHDKLFANFKTFRNANMDELVTGYAKELGLNMAQFQKDYTSAAAADQVKRDMAMGAKVGVRGTPHFFVNGKRVSGAQPLTAFESAVEDALKNLK